MIVEEAVEPTKSRLKDTFGNIALSALGKANENFNRTAMKNLSGQVKECTNQLECKKKLIDRSLENMNKELDSVKNLMTDLEADRSTKFGKLSESISSANEQTQRLQLTGERLN